MPQQDQKEDFTVVGDADDDVFDILAYPEEGQVINPNVPYTGALPAPLAAGQMIVLDGKVLPQAKRFALDLICGLSTRCDVALHVNPRLDERRIVRNSRGNERWADEEATATQRFPVKRGEQFFLYIFVTESHFLIAFNGRHYCSFTHRMPLWRVHALHVAGDIKIFQLEHRRNVTEYPQPSRMVAAVSLAVPTLSCPANLDRCCTHITQPVSLQTITASIQLSLKKKELHYVFDFASSLGAIYANQSFNYSFYFNLQQGKTTWPPPIILFHFNPRFKEGHIVVRNSRLKSSWGTEERGGPPPPFQPGTPFLLTIACEKDQFAVFVDGVPYVQYKYRQELSIVDTFLIEGDVIVSDIYIR
ncbi:hypothetical protein B566_EDAN002290 [Ephemera danica]|nr:hypothetical protein B566_EDAN002290 [Ephemera danica]